MFRSRRQKRAEEERNEAYAAKKTEDDHLESLSSKLVGDLRNEIRLIEAVEPFTEDWLDLTRVLDRVATVVRAEESFSEEGKEATLWEGDEAAIRGVLESGKMNLLVRMLDEYKAKQRSLAQEAAEADTHVHEPRFVRAALAFEEAICTILNSSVLHSEVAQTLDVSVITSMVRECLHFAVCRPELVADDLGSCLETTALSLVRGIVTAFDETEEERVMAYIRKAGLFSLIVQHLRSNEAKLGPAGLRAGLAALSAIVETEDFGINEAAYLPSEVQVRLLMQLSDAVSAAAEEGGAARRAVRALSDEIRRRKRSHTK